MSGSIVIAVDGPAASGKGTLARKLAAHYGFAYLDTGSLYRAVGHAVTSAGHDPADEMAALAAARNLDLSKIDERAIRTAEAGAAASIVAATSASVARGFCCTKEARRPSDFSG